MSSPDLSVVIPVYNGAEYLAETIEALLSQSFRNFELLAIDDGSKDNSGEIIESFRDPRIRLIRKQNGGLCDALNRGIAEARTPVIARNDQDDISFPERLERQMNALHQEPDAIALFGFNTKMGGKHTWSNADKLVMAPGQVRVYEPLKDGCLLGSTMLARVDALQSIGGFRQAYYPVDDWDLECRLSQAGKVLVLCEPVISYRFQAGANTYRVFSEMQTKVRWVGDSYDRRLRGQPELSLEEFVKQEPSGPWTRLEHYRNESAKWYMRTAGQSYLDGEYFAAARRFSAAFFFDPGDVFKRAYRLLLKRA